MILIWYVARWLINDDFWRLMSVQNEARKDQHFSLNCKRFPCNHAVYRWYTMSSRMHTAVTESCCSQVDGFVLRNEREKSRSSFLSSFLYSRQLNFAMCFARLHHIPHCSRCCLSRRHQSTPKASQTRRGISRGLEMGKRPTMLQGSV